MRITTTLLALSTPLICACSSSASVSMTGVRSDGLAVTCEPSEEEDVQTCTPEDGDNSCESWANGGSATVLWPPNHKLIRFTLDACASTQDCDDGGDDGDDGGDVDAGDGGDDGGDVDAGDDGGDVDGGGVDVVIDVVARTPPPAADPVPVAITSITADEAVEVGAGGDGHTVDFDIAIIDATTFDLRSERQGGGDGRVYRVNYTDSAGGTGSCEFMVPHDHRGPFGGAVDSGTVVTVTP